MYCWICERRVEAFEPYGIPRKTGRCPHCGAKPRYRAIAWFLEHAVAPRLGSTSRVLEVGPSVTSVRSYPQRLGGARYTAVDVRTLPHYLQLAAPHDFQPMDVTAMDFEDAGFDVILCNNTLPYIREDRRALAEIRRCLKRHGMAMLNTHVEPGATSDVASYRRLHPELDDAYFAENGDAWVYGEDFYRRIEEAALRWRHVGLFQDRDADFLTENGLKRHNELLLAFRSPQGERRFLS
jgi:SAM-dependent methyltransferase